MLFLDVKVKRISEKVEILYEQPENTASIRIENNFMDHTQNQQHHYFAQGYLLAEKDLWGLEVQRRKAIGTIDKIFGTDYQERHASDSQFFDQAVQLLRKIDK